MCPSTQATSTNAGLLGGAVRQHVPTAVQTEHSEGPSLQAASNLQVQTLGGLLLMIKKASVIARVTMSLVAKFQKGKLFKLKNPQSLLQTNTRASPVKL